MLRPLSIYSHTSLEEIQTIIHDITRIPFSLEKPSKLDDDISENVFKYDKETTKASNHQVHALANQQIIKARFYCAGLGDKAIPIIAIYQCDIDKLRSYNNQLSPDHITIHAEQKVPPSKSKLTAQPFDIPHKLYFYLLRNDYKAFTEILDMSEDKKRKEILETVSDRIHMLKVENLKDKLSKRFNEYTTSYFKNLNEAAIKNNLNVFLKTLLQTDCYDKDNKKIEPFLNELKNEVAYFNSVYDEKSNNLDLIDRLQKNAKNISDKLKKAHQSQPFSFFAKKGNRSKMASHIDSAIKKYSAFRH